MTFDKFVGEVQNRARLASLGDAVRAIHCTLAVLSQRLSGGEAKDLASQLPEEIGFYLLHTAAGQDDRFSADQFLNRVGLCERVDKPEAIFHVRAVFEVLRAAISAGQFQHVVEQLPSDFEPLLKAGSAGKMELKNSRGSRRRAAAQKTATSRRGTGGRENAKGSAERTRSSRVAQRAAGAWRLGR